MLENRKDDVNSTLKEINSIKSDLFRVQKELAELGAKKEANKLFTLIGKLEHFQVCAMKK